ncbi:MAG TPA: hypothetical protein VN461_13850 [Vicinamibacteria bacterium]|nr:hypothetical protein [Vicinamibacteria bacterium]
MGTGTKIAIGCGIAVLVGGAVVIVGLGAGAYWVKGKAQQFAGDITAKAQEIAKYEKEANRNTFSPPPDGVIAEPRLLKFLDVRKAIYAVYEQHKAEIDELQHRPKDSKQPGLGDVMELGGKLARLTSDIRLAQAKALAGTGMSDREYRYLQQAVYQTAWASQIQKETGQQPAQLMEQALKQAGDATQEAMQRAQQAGVSLPAAPSAEDQKQAGDVMKQLAGNAGGLAVPQANMDLFRKYEADIKQYAMSGLAFLGL